MSKKLKGNFMLLLTAMIWGSSFVAQRAGMDYIGPFTFNCLRCLLGGLVLMPVILLLSRFDRANADSDSEGKNTGNPEATDDPVMETVAPGKKIDRTLVLGGVSCGLVLFAASSLQQIGLVYTTAGKAGFITALYIVIVPVLGIFIGKKIRPVIWLCVGLSIVGLYLLCMTGGFSVERGDLLVLLCALGFALHILVIDYFSPKTDGIKMSCIQFWVCGIVSLPFLFLTETVDWSNILNCWLPICYAGILSCGVAYTLQIVAQKNTEPTVASLLLSLESVFAVLAGILVLHEQITPRELMGCLIVFIAIIIAQLPSREERLSVKQKAA